MATASSSSGTLRRGLGVAEATISGVGIILGAGIYVLVGEVAGEAGDAVWMSFALAAVAAGSIGLSYAELSSLFPRAGADYEYTRQALGLRPAFVVGWLIVIGNLVAAAAVALGFGSYLTTFLDVDKRLFAVIALVIATLVAFSGIRATVRLAMVLTVIEAAGLIVVVAVGAPHVGDVDLLDARAGAAGVFSGMALVFFAYIGFEQVATLAEETRGSSRAIPAAILLSLAVTTALYILVAIASVSVLGWEALSAADAPLADVVAEEFGDRASDGLAVVALFSTANTVLLLIVAASRLIYGMAAGGSLPRLLAWVHPGTKTPVRAIALCLVVSVGFALSGDLGLVAGATNFAVFISFGAINISLIVLRYRRPDLPRPFRVPFSIGRLPLIPVFALAAVAFMMVNLELVALLIGGALFVSGLAAMELLSLWKPHDSDERAVPDGR
jgi:APA family basic amino acid/polyamine antiporter